MTFLDVIDTAAAYSRLKIGQINGFLLRNHQYMTFCLRHDIHKGKGFVILITLYDKEYHRLTFWQRYYYHRIWFDYLDSFLFLNFGGH